MIYLITGVPGAGKTLRAVELIDQWVKEGRPVYARIDGLSMEGVKPAPDDWRDTPDGSVVVYDEAQQLFGAEGRSGRSARDEIQAMEVHRHTGHDIVLVTQHPGLIHAHVRRLVGRHEHVQRVFGSKRVIISWRDRAFDVDSRAERSSAVTMHWVHPVRLFGVYQSASLHVEKPRLPGRIKVLGLFALVMLGVMGVSLYRLSEKESSVVGPVVGTSVPADGMRGGDAVVSRDAGDVDHVASPPPKALPVVGGCIWSATRCQCYTRQGWPIEDDVGECFRRVASPLVTVVAMGDIERGTGTGAPAPEPQRERSEPAAPVQASSVMSSYSGPDPVAMSAYVNPVALSAGGGRGKAGPAPVSVEQAQPIVSAWQGSLAASTVRGRVAENGK